MACTPHKSNVPGDFYVEDGCCTSCGMPTTEAPDLFEYDPDGHCYVRKQPTATDEVDRMILAFEVQDIGCIRYKGTDRAIQIRLVESGEGEQCDVLNPDLKERNAIVQAERAARFATWKASQDLTGSASSHKSCGDPTVFRRFLHWLGIGA
ncbi:ferredoxin [Roseateles sp.]|uniref:ferredoxin n=1 Tax=Roseateles sp. TaxID=1971397 RepID=UPI003D117356